jgi:uncharacterized RmlC-like cupin family protein
MNEANGWRDAVKVMRGASLDAARQVPSARGRATAFEFAGTGHEQTWIGKASLEPSGTVPAHHHGRHEVVLFIIKGSLEIRWGERLEYSIEVSPGDFIYFAPYVPHQERNLSDSANTEFLVVRSDNERIAVPIDAVACAEPEAIS